MSSQTGNHSFGPEAEINYTSSILKNQSLSGKLSHRVDLIPGAFFSADPDGQIEGTFSSSDGNLISISYRVGKPLRWIALHLAMGEADLVGNFIVGVAIKSQAPLATTSRVCIRSGKEDGFEDCFFSKHLVSFSEESTHIDLLRLDQAREKIPLHAPWREVILFFKTSDDSLTIKDLKFFSV